MQSFLITSNNPQKRLTHALMLCKEAGIDPFDITQIERSEIPSKSEDPKLKQSLGIDDVKQMQKKLYLRPFRGDKKACILVDAHLLTVEAQNALLKVLEEPPVSTLLFLTAETNHSLLPTILSRCQLIALRDEEVAITEDEKKQLVEMIRRYPKHSQGESLRFAEIFAKSKPEALVKTEKLLVVAREYLLSPTALKDPIHTIYYIHLIKDLQKLRQEIQSTNINLRLALENFFLSR